MSHMSVKDRIWSVKERLKAAGTYNDTAAVIRAYAAMLGDLHDPQAAPGRAHCPQAYHDIRFKT